MINLPFGLPFAGARRRNQSSPWWSGLITPTHWWHAEDGATAGAALPDRVGAANMSVGAGTPSYSAIGWASAKPIIAIGAAGYIVASTTVADGNDTPVTVSAAFKSANAISSRILTFGNSANQATHGLWLANSGAASGNYTISRRSDGGTYLDAGSSGVAIDANRHVITWAFYGTTCTVYIDGSRVINSAPLDSPSLSVDNFVIGGWLRAGGVVAQGAIDIGEVIIASGGLTDTGALAAFHAAHLAEWPIS